MTGVGACGCCGGGRTDGHAPVPAFNRAGLPAISFRIGVHGSFLQAMKGRLSAADLPALKGLRQRDGGDLSIALLDAWATIADVLTFYQERIANEGYLRTATERFSVLQLARLVGYQARPGVASSVYLAYTVDAASAVSIAPGARAQSVPGPGETPQFFETAEALSARGEWSELAVRTSRPTLITQSNAASIETLFFAGATTNLAPGDRLLLAFARPATLETSIMRQVASVEASFPDDRTRVTLLPVPKQELRARLIKDAADSSSAFVRELRFNPSSLVLKAHARALLKADAPRDLVKQLEAFVRPERARLAQPAAQGATFAGLIGELLRPPTLQPQNSLRLERQPTELFAGTSDFGPKLVTGFFPGLRGTVYTAFASAPPPRPLQEVFVFRRAAALFGNNAPRRDLIERDDPNGEGAAGGDDWDPEGESGDQVFLDNAYPGVVAGDLILIESPTLTPIERGSKQTGGAFLGTVESVTTHPRTAYAVSGPTTQIAFADSWWTPAMATIRDAAVLIKAEKLTLAEEPITDPVGGSEGAARTVELARVYDGLDPGRWIIISGERLLPGGSSVAASERVMIAAVEQSGLLPSTRGSATPKSVTVLKLAGDGLAFQYARASVKVFGNVVLATQGETRGEVLGSGDATQTLQRFSLKKPPLTYVPAPTASGIASTLEVRVNDILWRESPTLAGLSSRDRRYVVRAADDGTVSVIFGNGERGARLPTGAENVKAVYRSGIGRAGNVQAGQISLLATRPLGVKEVLNPLPATGGADPDTRDQVRRNAPESVTALDRLVSVSDYADFARSFAGIGKAAARRGRRAGRPQVVVTIAGQENVPIARDSALFTSLTQAVQDLGDPALPVEIDVASVAFLFIRAKVRIGADRLWETVVRDIRTSLLDTFSFDRSDLGQGVFSSEVIAALQNVDGVEMVDLDALAGISPADVATEEDLREKLTDLAAGTVRPFIDGQDSVVYLTADLPDLLILQEITP